MIKKAFFTAILCLFFFPVYSQLYTPKLYNKIEGISMYANREPFFQIKPFDFTSFLKDSVYCKGIFIPKIPFVKLFFGQNRVEKPVLNRSFKNIDNMPIMVPDEKNSPMIIKTPDSRYKYTLLIKD